MKWDTAWGNMQNVGDVIKFLREKWKWQVVEIYHHLWNLIVKVVKDYQSQLTLQIEISRNCFPRKGITAKENDSDMHVKELLLGPISRVFDRATSGKTGE